MKNSFTTLAAGAALAFALPLAAGAQTMPAASHGAATLEPGTYQVLDGSGRSVGELIYGGGSSLRLVRQRPMRAAQAMPQTGSAYPSNWESFYQDANLPPAILDTP